MNRTILLFSVIVTMAVAASAQEVTDYDGNVYDTVMIGGQSWLKQNLRATHYRNGVPIPHVQGGVNWASITSGARCYYDNDSVAYDTTYGPLYNWFAVNNANGICPSGWHVPSDGEWTALENYLGGWTVAGGPLKEAGTSHWLAPNAGATNSTGFTGLPGGMLGTSYTFDYMFENGIWWTSTMQSPAAAYSRYFWYMNAAVDRNPTPKSAAFSIRCIKDPAVGIGKVIPPDAALSPNPATDHITIRWDVPGTVAMMLYDSQGRLVSRTSHASGEIVIRLAGWAPGIYHLVLQSGSMESRQSFIKH